MLKTKGKPNGVDIFVGKRVRHIREVRGMSQEMLGRKIGITFQQVQKYENGMNRIACGRLYDISKVVEKPVGWFFPPPVSQRSFKLATSAGRNRNG